MKKYLKRFEIMFVMALILSLGFCISAFAATDTGVVGTSNLNGTAQNSAVVGKALNAPEIGWKRYDDTNSEIQYSGSSWSGSNSYGIHISGKSNANSGEYFTFKFEGTKFRIISGFAKASDHTKSVDVYIDGSLVSNYSEYNSADESGSNIMVYEKAGLTNNVHTVKIINRNDYVYFELSAIDIDADGYLVDSNESISLNNSTMNLNVGDSQQLTATTTPAGAQVTWTSSDSSIASVDSNGNVTGVSKGACTITATTSDGLSAICTVNVNKEDESIILDKSSMDLNQGDSGQLTATVSTTTSAQVTWTSSDPSVATVDSTGKVTAIGAGTATITATTTDGSNLSASCAVNVAAGSGDNTGGTTTGASAIVNIAYAKGDNTNNAGGDVSIIFNGVPDTTLSVVKTASVKSVWVGDTFTYTIVVTNTGSKTAKAVVINDSDPNHIQFMPSGITTTQGTVDPSSSASNIIVNVGDIPPSGTVTITVPATVVL